MKAKRAKITLPFTLVNRAEELGTPEGNATSWQVPGSIQQGSYGFNSSFYSRTWLIDSH
jgi:hypothetical protein